MAKKEVKTDLWVASQLKQCGIEYDAQGSNVKELDEDTRATVLVSMTNSDKERLTSTAKAHGLSLSAFSRLAADEYIAAHKW